MIVTHILAFSPSPTVYNARSKPTAMDSVVESVKFGSRDGHATEFIPYLERHS